MKKKIDKTQFGTKDGFGAVPVGLGVGGGTLIVSLVKNLPEDNSYKSWLLILAPTLSFTISIIYQKIEKMYWKRELKKIIEELNILIKDPNTTTEKKVKYENKLKELLSLDIDLRLEKIKSKMKRDW